MVDCDEVSLLERGSDGLVLSIDVLIDRSSFFDGWMDGSMDGWMDGRVRMVESIPRPRAFL